jgi:hypothetical protein
MSRGSLLPHVCPSLPTHVPFRSVPTHSQHTPSPTSRFPLRVMLFLLKKWKHQSVNWNLLWRKAWVSSLTNAPPSWSQLTLHLSHLPFLTQPKRSRSHWLNFLMICLFPWIFEKCWRSKRGLLSLSCYLRDLSLPHYLPFFTVLLYYQILSISLSLTLLLCCFGSLVLEELEQLCCYNLFHWIIRIALEESGVLDFVYMLHLCIRWYCSLLWMLLCYWVDSLSETLFAWPGLVNLWLLSLYALYSFLILTLLYY